MKLRPFKKGMRTLGNIKSIGTLKVKKFLRRLDKENGTKEIESTQENVESVNQYSWDIGNNNREEKKEEDDKS